SSTVYAWLTDASPSWTVAGERNRTGPASETNSAGARWRRRSSSATPCRATRVISARSARFSSGEKWWKNRVETAKSKAPAAKGEADGVGRAGPRRPRSHRETGPQVPPLEVGGDERGAVSPRAQAPLEPPRQVAGSRAHVQDADRRVPERGDSRGEVTR